MPPLETLGHSQASLAQFLVELLLLSPGSWCTQDFACALQKSVSPVLWKFCNQIPLAFKFKFLAVLLPMHDLQVGKSAVDPTTFTTVTEVLWYNCFPVCDLPAQQLYNGANGDLLQEDSRHTLCLPGLLLP